MTAVLSASLVGCVTGEGLNSGPVKGRASVSTVVDVEVDDLVSAARSGDRDALAGLYRRFYPVVAGWLYRRVVNAGEVDDLAQNVFVRMMVELGSYQPRAGSPFVAWLIGTVASFELMVYGQRRARHQRAVAGQAETVRHGPLKTTSGQEAEGYTLSPEVAGALARLSPARRRCVQLRYLEGLPPVTTAAVTGTARTTVNNTCSRALAQLRQDLAPLAPQRRSPAPPAGVVLLTAREAAAQAGYHDSTIHYAIQDRRLTAYQVNGQWHIPLEALAWDLRCLLGPMPVG